MPCCAGVGLGSRDVRLHNRLLQRGYRKDRFVSKNDGTTAVGHRTRSVLHPALHVRQRLLPERYLHARHFRGVALRQALVRCVAASSQSGTASRQHEERSGERVLWLSSFHLLLFPGTLVGLWLPFCWRTRVCVCLRTLACVRACVWACACIRASVNAHVHVYIAARCSCGL